MISTSPDIYNPKVRTGTLAGPASYTTGGYTWSPAGFNFIKFARLTVASEGTIALPFFFLTYNSPANGQVNVKVMKGQYDKITAVNSAITPPSGVSVAGSNNQTVSSTSHIHAFTHDHPASAASSTMSGATGAVLVDAVSGTNQSTHTHTVNPSNFAPDTTSTSHNHIANILYAHTHTTVPQTTALTTLSTPEVPNLTNLSTSTWAFLVIGV